MKWNSIFLSKEYLSGSLLLLPPLDVPVVEPRHGDLGYSHLVTKIVQIKSYLPEILHSGLAIFSEKLLGVVQGVLQHHIGPEPQAHLVSGRDCGFRINLVRKSAFSKAKY